LFSQSSIVRELNAVDSEQKKNLQDDKRRASQVNKHLSKPGHVWSKFGTGNKVTLTSAACKVFQKGAKSKAIDGCASFEATSEASEGPSVTSSTLSVSSPPIGSGENLESSDDESGGAIGRETRRRLIEWWSKEYCAGHMRLCIFGKGVAFCVYV
jgi:insulysin